MQPDIFQEIFKRLYEIQGQVTEIHKKVIADSTTIDLIRWIVGVCAISVVGTCIYVVGWTRKFKRRAFERMDKYFSDDGEARERMADEIHGIEAQVAENSGLYDLLESEIRGEGELRKQALENCKERCRDIRCKGDNR